MTVNWVCRRTYLSLISTGQSKFKQKHSDVSNVSRWKFLAGFAIKNNDGTTGTMLLLMLLCYWP